MIAVSITTNDGERPTLTIHPMTDQRWAPEEFAG